MERLGFERERETAISPLLGRWRCSPARCAQHALLIYKVLPYDYKVDVGGVVLIRSFA